MTANGRDNIAAIVWAAHQNHAEKYARSLNARLYNVHYLRQRQPLLAPIKYIPQAIKTWLVLARQKPDVVYVMNPPVFAALSVFIYCRLAGVPYVMDTHSPALYSTKWGWSVPLQRFLARFAMVNIVDQERYKRLFESWGARALVLEKPPSTSYREEAKPDVAGRFSITVVNTFASDEPVWPILEAARDLPDVHFYILGEKSRAKPSMLSAAPANVTFTGYLYNDDYWNQLRESRAVMVLTEHNYSLLAGAQDGMVIGKPLIVSKKPALLEYFTKGAIFVENTPESIVEGVKAFREQEDRLKREIVELAAEKIEGWEANFKALKELIGGVRC